MPIRTSLQSLGLGITETSRSLTGGLFTRTTKTPHTPYRSQVRQEGESHPSPESRRDAIARKDAEHARRKTAVKDSTAGHIRYGEATLTDAAAALQADDYYAWRTALHASPRRFNVDSSDRLAELERQIAAISLPDAMLRAPGQPARSSDARILPGASRMVLLNATAALCRRYGLHAEQAANALACLQHVDLAAAIAAPHSQAGQVPNAVVPPLRSDGRPFDAGDLGNAWRLAIELQEGGEPGFTMLQYLGKSNAPAHPVHPAVAAERDALLRTYLIGAREKLREAAATRALPPAVLDGHGKVLPDPRSLHRAINHVLNRGQPPSVRSTSDRRRMDVEPGSAHEGLQQTDNQPGGRILPARATLLDGALKAVSFHMRQIEAHAADPAHAAKAVSFDRDAIAPGTDPNAWHILDKDCYWGRANAVRNGLYSKTDPLYLKLERRARRMGEWARRAREAGPGKWEQLQRKFGQMALPVHKKSPFSAFNRFARRSPERMQSGTDAGGIADGEAIRQDLIRNLEKAIECEGLEPLTSGGSRRPLRSTAYPLGHPREGQPAVANNPGTNVLRQMVRLALLNLQYRFNARKDGLHMLLTRHKLGDPLPAGDLKRARQVVYEMFAGGPTMQSRETLTEIEELLERENVQLSPERLAIWAVEVDGPELLPVSRWHDDAIRHAAVAESVDAWRQRRAPVAAAGQVDGASSWSRPDWDRFVAGVNRTLAGRVEGYRNDIAPLPDLGETGAAQLFEEVIARQKLGHLLRLSDGGWRGLKTQGVSYILSRLLSIGTMDVGIDLRYSRGRHAELQVGTTTGGNDLFAGTVKAHRVQVGVGGSIGPGHASKSGDGWAAGFAAGASLTPYSREWSEKTGALFRFRRVFSGIDTDALRNRRLGRLQRKLMDPDHPPADDEGGPWTDPPDPADRDILIRILHEFGDVSAAWVDARNRTFEASASVQGLAGFRVGAWGPAIGAGLGAKWNSVRSRWREQGGSLSQKRDGKASEFTVQASGLISTVAAVVSQLTLADDAERAEVHELLNPAIWSGTFKAAMHDGAVGSAQVYRTGTARSHNWIYHDGTLTYTPGICSFYQKVHKNAAAYVASLVGRLERLAHDKAKAFDPLRYNRPAGAGAGHGPAQPDERSDLLDREMRTLLRELRAALKAEPTQEFSEYYEYRAEFLQMKNDLEGLIRSERAVPDWHKDRHARERVRDWQRQLDKLDSLDDAALAAHGEFRFPIKFNLESLQVFRGLNSMLVNWREQSMAAARIDMVV